MRIGLLAFPLLLLLGACEGHDPPTLPPQTIETARAGAAGNGSENAIGRLALTSEGMMRIPETGEPSKAIAFGAPRATVESLVERVAGPATGRSRNEECGAGPIESTAYGPLTLNFQDGRFVGWFAGDGTAMPTIDGLRPGVAREDVARERTVTVLSDSTLEGEFEYALPDGSVLGGFFDGAGADARVTALHAGINCFFR